MSKPTSDRRATGRKHPWPMVRLGDVCEFSRGLTYSKSDEVQFSLNVVLRSNNVDLETGRLVLDELKYIRDSIEIPTSKRVAKGAILMCTANGSKQHLGKVALIDGDYNYAFGGFMGLLTPNASIDSRYLYWQLMSFEFKRLVTTLTDGANINNLKFADISQFTFLLPPLSEQKEIVARLERELAAVEKMKKGFESLAETAKAEFKAELKEVFEEIMRKDVETQRLGDVCDTISTRGHQIKQSEIGDCGKFPVVSQSENDIEGWTNEDIAIDAVPLVLFGDHTCVVKKIDEPFVVGADGAKLLRSSECDNSFLFYFIKEAAVSLLDGEYRRHYSDLANAEIPIPPLSVQREVVARLDLAKARAEKLEAKAQEGVAVCETMRKAILKEVFDDGWA